VYLKEFENVEVILNHASQPEKWKKTIGYKPEINKPFNVHWSLLKTKSLYRRNFIKVKCDDCEDIFERRIRDLDIEKNYHLCSKCQNKGKRNGMYGKDNENAREGLKKWTEINGNPFTWDSVKKKIKDGDKERVGKIVKKTRGQKRSEDSKKRISLGLIKAVKDGRLKPGKGWFNIPVKQYKGIDYQGTYELKFLEYVDKKGKLDLIERGPSVNYSLNEIEHLYFIDYRIKNTNIVFEIKSDYYWKKLEETNILKKLAAEKEYDYYLVINNNFKLIDKLF
jgi:hypothetical protein